MRLELLQTKPLPDGADKSVSWAIFSDLHAGGNKDFNQFAFLYAHRNAIQKMGVDSLHCYFLGDIWDVLGGKKSLPAVKRAFPHTEHAVQGGVYFYGNHEGKAKGNGYASLNLNGFHLEHGHKSDWFFTRWRKPIGWLVMVFTGILERVGFKDIDKTPREMNEAEFNIHFQKYIRPYVEKHFDSHPETAVFICGHTHRPTINKMRGGEKLYVNCGDFVGHLTFVVIRNGSVELYRVV